MSGRDIQFIKELAISNSDVARILDVSRQSVSRGLLSDSDYLSQSKLTRISERVPRVFDIEASSIRRLISKFYPHYEEGTARAYVASQMKISIDGDIYLACNRLPYYMDVYKKLFLDLGVYVRACKRQKLLFAFPDPDTLRYNQKKIIAWLDDDRAIASASVIVCPSVAVFPFSVCGYEGKKPVVFFCENDGFSRQNENNSRCIVSYVVKYINAYRERLKPLKKVS
jgi:hypothetical protein